ncbi:MAG: hypothetical protein QF552_01775 [Litorilituus sp.]|jgi:hypothetical protein|nr:hypothetical protein [Litorilituus sp.]
MLTIKKQLYFVTTVVVFFTAIIASTVVKAEPVKENIGLYGGYVADIEAMDNTGTTEILIAVENSQRGVYRYMPATGSSPATWVSTTNPTTSGATGHLPGFATAVEEDKAVPGLVYAVLSNERTMQNKELYVSTTYGRMTTGPVVSWSPVSDPSTGMTINGVEMLHSHSSGGLYIARRQEIIRMMSGGSGNVVFQTSALPTAYSTYEIVDFAIAGSKSGYVVLRDGLSNSYALASTQWNLSTTPAMITLPTAAPVELRTGTCPLSDCSVIAELVAVDPADPDGNTLYIAGSSINAMIFKSTDGGLTWDDGFDFQCSNDSRTTSSCTGFGFTDGYPRGDVAIFRGTSSSGSESRHVFIGRVVFDNNNPASGWQVTPKLSSLLYRSGPGSSSLISQSTNANDPSLEIDPNDATRLFIATDLAIGEITHVPSSGYASPAGSELGNARGIEGLVINDLDYFENSTTNKELWIVSKSGAAFARGYDPTNPTSVVTAGDWVYPIYAGGDGAPPRTVVIDPNNKATVLIGTSAVYLNQTGDGVDPSTGVVDYNLVAEPSNWSRVFDPYNFAGVGEPLESDRIERSYTTALEWQTAGSCDRVYLSVANTDTGTQGGIFYSDDKGLTWNIDTLNGSSPLLKMPVNSLLSKDNFIWAGVGDRDGRSPETGIRARVSLCASSAWWKPTHSTDALFADLQTKYVVAIDGVIPSTGSVTAVVYIATDRDLYKGAYIPGSACTSFDCWQFSDVTPTGVYDDFSAIAVEPTDEDHVWVAFGNCIQESNDGGTTWSAFGGSCTDDHEEVDVLVYDDLIAGTQSGAFAYVESEVANTAPNADIATLGIIPPGAVVTLDASKSSDTQGDTLSYTWSQISGLTVELSSTNAISVTFTAPNTAEANSLTFELTVSDGALTDTVSIIVDIAANQPPTVSVDSPTSVSAGASVTMNASGSSDPEGDSLSYSWSQTSGTTVTLSSTTDVSVSFTAPSSTTSTTLNFTITVSDGLSTSNATISTTVAAEPSTGSGKSSSGGSSNWIILALSIYALVLLRIRKFTSPNNTLMISKVDTKY